MKRENFLKDLTILYVEDEEDVREEIEDMLNIKVKKLITASNGKEALDIYRQEEGSIDIIVTDIQMPVMDGLEFIDNIRKEDEDIPIIITTAFNEVEFLKKAIDLHVDKYITKPIDMVQLYKVIDRASIVIKQKKQIKQRDLVIRTILDLKPYYSILLEKSNVSKIQHDIFAQLNFSKEDNIKITIETEHESKKVTSLEIMFKNLFELRLNCKIIKNIYLENKSKNNIKYTLKPYFFEETDLIVLSFFDISKIDYVGKCFDCMDNKVTLS